MGLSCPLGDILDLSASGMRVQTLGKPPVRKGQHETFFIDNGEQRLRLSGEVVWVRRRRVFDSIFEIGIQFGDQREQVRRALETLGEHGYIPSGDHAHGDGPPRDRLERLIPSGGVGIEIVDLYAVLGVSPDATREELRIAHRDLAFEYHPDRCEDEDAQEKYDRVRAAYLVLREPRNRARYDQMLRRSREADAA